MILLTVDEIIELHTKLILKTGGTDGLRDAGVAANHAAASFVTETAGFNITRAAREYR